MGTTETNHARNRFTSTPKFRRTIEFSTNVVFQLILIRPFYNGMRQLKHNKPVIYGAGEVHYV